MLTIGSMLIIVFVLVEWKVAKLPIMPSMFFCFLLFFFFRYHPSAFTYIIITITLTLTHPLEVIIDTSGLVRLFQSDYSANLVLIMATMQGVVYWANLFYIPLYLQTVRGYSPIMSGVIILPMVASHGIGSLVSGQIISRTGHYSPIIIAANFVWLLGISLQTLYTRTTPVWVICVVGFLEGIGIGCTFQRTCFYSILPVLFPLYVKISEENRLYETNVKESTASLIALLAHSRKADRAVANSLRNFLRIMGGSVGLTGKFSFYSTFSFDQRITDSPSIGNNT